MKKAGGRIAFWTLPVFLLLGAPFWFWSQQVTDAAIGRLMAQRLIEPKFRQVTDLAHQRSCFSTQCLQSMNLPTETDGYNLILYDLKGDPFLTDRPGLKLPELGRSRKSGPGLTFDDRFFWTGEYEIQFASGSLAITALLEDPQTPETLLKRIRAVHASAVGAVLLLIWLIIWGLIALFVDRPVSLALAASASLAQKMQGQSDLQDLAARAAKGASRHAWQSAKEQQSETRLRETVMNISHDLRTPVSSLSASLDMLQAGSLDNETSARLINTVHEQTTVLAKMIDDLFEITKYETQVKRPVRETVPIAELTAQVVRSFEPVAAKKQVRIENELDDTEAEVSGDGEALRRMLANILQNAIAHCRPKDRVTISCQTEAHGVLLHVRDTGPGLPDGDHDKLFERYYRGEGGGMGIGLYLAARIVESHKGQIAAKDTGQGALFTIWLPYSS